MSAAPARQKRRLLFRLYLWLAIGLVAVAAALDYGYRELQARLDPPTDPWRAATIALLRDELVKTPPPGRGSRAAQLEATLGVPVRLLGPGDLAGEPLGAGGWREVYDAQGRLTLLVGEADGAALRIGPVDTLPDSPWLDWLPPVFYIAIFVLLGLWLRPLLRDLDTITESTRAFAADYRDARRTAPEVSSLKELAENFDAMADRLGTLIQAQKELTSALSHEMRTPLARIRFALAVVGDEANARQREELAAVSGDVEEIDRLISTMLSYARLDHPDTRMRRETLPAAAWLDTTVERSRLPDSDVSASVAAGIDTVNVDPGLMTLALSNLLVNACRHAAGRVEVRLERDGDRLRLEVHDDGEGIPEADRERVFKAFTRLDGSRSRDTGGSGLGLAIVARIASLHGGTARAGESAHLGGACIRVSWPAAN